MIFRQLFEPDTSTWTYLLADETTREAVLIDTTRQTVDRDLQTLRELDLTLVATVETHVHADHITGAWKLKQATGCEIVYPKASAVDTADRLIGHGESLTFGRHRLEARATPGHTDGCTTYVLHELRMAFTGDALLIRGAGRTDFQQGSPTTLYDSVHGQILSLPADTKLYPGHDYKGRTVTTVAEELAHNPRLGKARTKAEFVDIMDNLGLAYPRYIDKALPANLNAGRTDEDGPQSPFGDACRAATGAIQVSADWVARHGTDVRLIDVRQPNEYTGPLGHVQGAELMPLNELLSSLSDADRDSAMVTICRSGGRSDKAAVALEKHGFSQVASMTGGMMAFRHLHPAGV